MPITSAVPPGVTPTTNPSGLPGATGSIGSTGSTGATTFGDAMREVEASRATTVEGLPATVLPGATYELSIRFDHDAAIAGFLAAIEANGQGAGKMTAPGEELEAQNHEIRSSAPVLGDAVWTFRWTAPEPLSLPIILNIAANASNDDQSPFGDRIHFHAVMLAE